MGKSTKSHRSDLIGHKGIGFKCVFSVAVKALWISYPTNYFFQIDGGGNNKNNENKLK